LEAGVAQQRQQQFCKLPGKCPTRVQVSPLAPNLYGAWFKGNSSAFPLPGRLISRTPPFEGGREGAKPSPAAIFFTLGGEIGSRLAYTQKSEGQNLLERPSSIRVKSAFLDGDLFRTFGVSTGQVYLAKHRITELVKEEVGRLEKEML
jgi:hypothetical protein